MLLPILLATLLLSSAPPSIAAAPVLDVTRKPLQPNTGYYMLSVSPPSAGGVTLGGIDQSRPGSCPRYVAVASTKTDRGIPVSIVPRDKAAKTVEVGKLVQLKFAFLYHCIPDGLWAPEQGAKPSHFLPGSTGATVASFSLASYKSGYALSYCSGGRCVAMGVRKEGSDLFLVPGGSEFTFVFQKYQ